MNRPSAHFVHQFRLHGRVMLLVACLLFLQTVNGCDDEAPIEPLPDTVAPATITYLSADPVTSRSVALTWVASGDDGDQGRAVEYDVRYTQDPLQLLTAGGWTGCARYRDAPGPSSSGAIEKLTVDRLTPTTTWYFAIRVRDDAHNWSGTSAVASATTTDDPYVLKSRWGSTGSGPGQFMYPVAIAGLLVLDAGNHRIQFFNWDSTLTQVTSIPGEPGENNHVWDVAIGFSTLFILDGRSPGHVLRLKPNTTPTEWDSACLQLESGVQEAQAIAADDDDHVFVVSGTRIHHHASDGRSLGCWVGDAERTEGIQDVAVGGNGAVYLACATQIRKFTKDGTLLISWDTYDLDGLPAGSLAADDHGDVYALSSSGNHYRVRKFDPDGHLLVQWTEPGGAFDLAVSGQDVFVLELSDGQLRIARFGPANHPAE